MKVTICGSGPLAVEMFFELDHLGAQVTLFANHRLGGMVRKMVDFMPDLSMGRPFNEITSPLGRKILKMPSHSFIPTASAYWEEYLSLLIEKIPASSCKKTKALRVQKRFLQLNEEIPGKSRLFDLFRLFYLMGPVEEMSLAPTTSSGEKSKGLESFMDFDVIVDARGTAHHPKALGGDGFALNEPVFVDAEDVLYGLPSVQRLEKILKTARRIVMAGSGTTTALIALKLASWMDKNQLIIASSESEPFFTNKDIPQDIKKRLDALIAQKKEDYSIQYSKYESLFEDFKKLDDHVRVKTTPPKKPLCSIEIMGGCNVTAIDRLSDREGIFVTVETAGFRKGEDKLQTLHADCLIAATGYRRDTTFDRAIRTSDRFDCENISGRHPEPGYYTLGVASDLSCGIKQIKHIREDILVYFEKR